VLAAALLLGAGCGIEKGRFASCETDEDCKSSDESRPYCFNLRCVACAYDRHCGEGEICDKKDNECAPL
jgi:Cys-rich repeat protein